MSELSLLVKGFFICFLVFVFALLFYYAIFVLGKEVLKSWLRSRPENEIMFIMWSNLKPGVQMSIHDIVMTTRRSAMYKATDGGVLDIAKRLAAKGFLSIEPRKKPGDHIICLTEEGVEEREWLLHQSQSL